MKNPTNHESKITVIHSTELRHTDTPTKLQLVEVQALKEDGSTTYTMYELIVQMTPSIHRTSGSVTVVLRSGLFDLEDGLATYQTTREGISMNVGYAGSNA